MTSVIETESTSTYSELTLLSNSGYIDTLLDEELFEMENEIFEYLFDFFENDILQISNPNFEDKLILEITDSMYESCLITSHADRFDNSFDDIHLFVKGRVITYTQTIMIPRSCQTSFLLTNILDLEKMASSTTKLNKLRNAYQPQQRTPEWYIFRHNLITASNIGKIIGTEAKINSLIYEKCKPIEIYENNDDAIVNTSSPMHWGQKYESVTIMIYENIYSTKIEDFGCIQHADISCLGSSPDGINVDPTNSRYCRMLEVKNIVNRDITGIPKHDYWVQCQLQMEVCDLDTCDFIETRIKEYQDIDFYSDEISEYKGVMLHFVSKTALGSKPHYVIMPINEDKIYDKAAIHNWINKIKNELKESYSLYEVLYWFLHEISVVLIPRNEKWFKSLIPKIHTTWNTITRERITGFEHRAPKKRNVKPTCVLDQNDTKIISTLP